MKFTKFFFSLPLLALISCSSGDGFGDYLNTNHLGVDSSNNRLFISQPQGELFALTASTRESLDATPIVDEDTNESTNALLPSVVRDMVVAPTGGTSRLFLLGGIPDSDGNIVFNRIRVIDFDGSSFSQPGFSPIVLSDGDDATDETINAFSDIVYDPQNARIYVTDADAGMLYAFNVSDGTSAATPMAIAGSPLGASLDNGRLYICNTSLTESEQVVTVVNTTDFSTTAIDLDTPCNQSAAATNSSGTVLLVKNAQNGQILIRRVDTTTYASSTALSSATTGLVSGSLSSGAGISSVINSIILNESADGTIYGYLGEQDGNIEFLTIPSDLSSYSLQTLATSATDIGPGVVYESGGSPSAAFFVANSGYLITIGFGSAEADLDN